MAAMPARREIVCVRLCHAAAMAALSAGENKHVCSSYGSFSLLPASELVSCLPWVQ